MAIVATVYGTPFEGRAVLVYIYFEVCAEGTDRPADGPDVFCVLQSAWYNSCSWCSYHHRAFSHKLILHLVSNKPRKKLAADNNSTHTNTHTPTMLANDWPIFWGEQNTNIILQVLLPPFFVVVAATVALCGPFESFDFISFLKGAEGGGGEYMVPYGKARPCCLRSAYSAK